MFKNIAIIIVLFACSTLTANAQKIFYSEPDHNDQKSLDFDVAGKINNHYLIYKNYRADNYISVYDGEMKLVENVTLDFMPDKLLGTDLITYKDFFYLFYQYQKRGIAYVMAAKIDGDGKIIGDPLELDTTIINSFSNNRVYNILGSEDKQRIAVFKINSKNNDRYFLTTSLFDNNLKLTNKSRVTVDMPNRSDFLSEFTLGNDGSLVFLRAAGSADNDNINKLTLLSKQPDDDSVYSFDLNVKDIYLDDVKIKIDNINKHYLISSFYSKQKRGNIDGLYCAVWDKRNQKIMYETSTTFSEEIRNNAKNEGNPKYAFNDFYIQNILVRKDGGFVIASESVYSSTRGSNYSRWDYLYGSPFMRPSDYYLYSPSFYNSYYYPWSRWGNYGGFQVNRYFADNIAIIALDSTANMQWTNIINKSQYDDYTDNFIGYGTLNTGGKFHFIFNQLEKRTLLLTDQSITPDGEVNRSPTLHNLSKEYQFMPRYAKQVSSYELVVPCQYRNYICFAKVEY
ncbi:hypothetical protein FRZ67_00410 [Panacibacter ginsenosidivorans]|uniref:Uncharacterized protein n=1 Tax=Panacibacter ginsenosidivorans TaxID=1813871 RepID=A0A5B8V2U5_9BACT|nr:hypothetical protein [Panacibacter ginsenosidivorans]QEC65837.1 hypothetical protein FRZ67_00410 [Panacibacter ginsenosidivorans]